MPFTAQELSNIINSALDVYLDKGTVFAQEIQNKPMWQAFDRRAKSVAGGRGDVSIAVESGTDADLSLVGYTHDDVVTYGNPAQTKRINFKWFEHFLGIGYTWTEMKHNGITITDSNVTQSQSMKDGREEFILADTLEQKIKNMNERYEISMDSLIHGDGSGDAKSLAGIRSIILDNPALGSLGGLNRTTNAWWRNRAATTAANAAGTGFAPITSSAAGGGALLQFLQKEERQLDRFTANRRPMRFAGSDFIDAMEKELRANGQYAQTGWQGGDGTVDGAMPAVTFNRQPIVYDPTLDDLGLSKRMYNIDMNAIYLFYLVGEKKKKSMPARPHDRFVTYHGLTTTAGMLAYKLNSSAVYDIA